MKKKNYQGVRVALRNKKRVKKFLLTMAVVIFAFAAWVLWGNTAVELNSYTLESDKVPDSFDGYRIAQVSDFHNAQIGKDNKKLLNLLEKAEPDIIAITGDIVDWRSTDIEITRNFVGSAVKIAPCYYITGNNEAYIAETYNIKEMMKELGVTVLEDETKQLEINGEKILLAGVDDPCFSENYSSADSVPIMQKKLEKITVDEGYTVLLSHRPELFSVYCEYNVDLVLSGHAHGGQFRIPFLGGVIAPDQGLFPKYDAGLYTQGGTNMLVSRGIGNSIIPLRVNNRPEVVVVELKTVQ